MHGWLPKWFGCHKVILTRACLELTFKESTENFPHQQMNEKTVKHPSEVTRS